MENEKTEIDREEEAPASSVPASEYIRVISRRCAVRLWWLALIPVILAVVGLMIDIRWLIVALMFVFIIYPMAMTFAVLGYSLKPRIITLTRVRSAALTEQLLLLRDSDDSIIYECRVDVISDATLKGGRLMLVIGPAPDDVVLVPLECIASDDVSAIMRMCTVADTLD